MKLSCEGCDAVLRADSGEALHDAMLAHARDVHSNLWKHKTPREIEEMEQVMSQLTWQMIADQNRDSG